MTIPIFFPANQKTIFQIGAGSPLKVDLPTYIRDACFDTVKSPVCITIVQLKLLVSLILRVSLLIPNEPSKRRRSDGEAAAE